MHDTKDIQDRAIRLLIRWAHASEAYWHVMDDDRALGCYGPGYRQWGVQSNLNYAAAAATLSARCGSSDRDLWRARACSALRYALGTHITGFRRGADGKSWGNTWISMLGIERAMHGIARLDSDLPPADREALRRLLVSEADWLLLNPSRKNRTGVRAGLWGHEGCNNPENNIWSGCLLWRVAQRYPDEPNARAWQEQAHRFLMNGVSIEADAQDTTLVAGRPVCERHVGANFFPNYALDHHSYFNVGYMAICVSNAAILHFDLKPAGASPPESLYHHQAALWKVLRRFVFDDGRIARIGGDSRVRYAYCQEYLLPALLFAADRLKDGHALELTKRLVRLMEKEAEHGDGMFYGCRLDGMRRRNPHYYTRLESDRACVLAMLLNYLPLVEQPPRPDDSFENSVSGTWVEADYGAVMHRCPTRLASFAWRANGLAQALCLPPRDSSLAEWRLNLSPVVQCLGDDGSKSHRRLRTCHVEPFDGGFLSFGSVTEGVDVLVDEGASCTNQAVTHVAFAALPDGRTCLCLQYVVAADDKTVYLAALRDLHLVIPNDLFNGYRRILQTASGSTILNSPPESDVILEFESRWANIDDRLGIVAIHGADRILLDRSFHRRAGRYQSLFTEEFCFHARNGAERCRPSEILVDVGFAIVSEVTADMTSRVSAGPIPFDKEGIRGIWVEGADGKRYALLANFTPEGHTVNASGTKIELPGETAAFAGI